MSKSIPRMSHAEKGQHYAYMKYIKKLPTLTEEQEIAYGRLAIRGNTRAAHKLVTANLRFVVFVANNYVGHTLPLSDLIGAGNQGLVKAAFRYNPDKKHEGKRVKFISYAVWWIRHAIVKALGEASGITKMNGGMFARIEKMDKAWRKLSQKYDREPTEIEISEETGVKLELMQKVLKIWRTPASMDIPLKHREKHNGGPYNEPLKDVLPSEWDTPEEEYEEKEKKEAILKGFRFLTENQATILIKYFGLEAPPMNLEKISQQLNITRERVRQIKERALWRLRQNHVSRREFKIIAESETHA